MAIQCNTSHKGSMMRRHLTNELAISLIEKLVVCRQEGGCGCQESLQSPAKGGTSGGNEAKVSEAKYSTQELSTTGNQR